MIRVSQKPQYYHVDSNAKVIVCSEERPNNKFEGRKNNIKDTTFYNGEHFYFEIVNPNVDRHITARIFVGGYHRGFYQIRPSNSMIIEHHGDQKKFLAVRSSDPRANLIKICETPDDCRIRVDIEMEKLEKDIIKFDRLTTRMAVAQMGGGGLDEVDGPGLKCSTDSFTSPGAVGVSERLSTIKYHTVDAVPTYDEYSELYHFQINIEKSRKELDDQIAKEQEVLQESIRKSAAIQAAMVNARNQLAE